jgi:hypothetical protein
MATSSRSTSALRRWFVTAIVLAGLAGTNATGTMMLPPGDGDLGWQHWLGVQILHAGLPHALGSESFAAAGAPWVPQEWLFCVLLAAAGMHGLSWLFALAVALCSALALACVALRCARHGADPVAVAFVLVFVDAAMAQPLGVRVQVVAWALLAAFLLALELPARYRWTAVAIAAAWANVHASVMLAPLLAGAAALGSAVRGDRRAFVHDGVLAAWCAAATCATPLGIALPAYAAALVRSPVRDWIQEWHRTSFGDLGFALGALPLIALAAVAAPRADRRTLALTLPFCYLAFAAVRNVPLVAIACAPLAATALTVLLPSLASFRPFAGRAVATVTVAAVFGVAAGATALAARGAHDTRPLPAIRALAHVPGTHRLLCENFAWCGFAVDTGTISVFVDGRADPFPIAVWNDYDLVRNAHAGWRSVVKRYGVNALLVRRDGPLDRAARKDGWRSIRDAPIRLLVRVGRRRSPVQMQALEADAS